MEDRDSPTVPGSAMLAMETLMELDAQRAPQTAQLHPGSTRTVSATAYYRKHKRCVPLHDQLVQESRAALLSSLVDWSSKRRFVATIMEWAVPPSSAGAPVAVMLRGHLAVGVAVRARGGGKLLRVVMGEPKPLADSRSNLSEMQVNVHIHGLTRGLFYLEVEAPAPAVAQQGAKKLTLKTCVPVLVSDDSAVRREVNRLRAVEICPAGQEDDDSHDTLPFVAIEQLMCNLGMVLCANTAYLEQSFRRLLTLRRLLRALVMNNWLATAAAVLKVAAELSPLSQDEQQAADSQEALVASGLPKPPPDADNLFPATWPAPFAPVPPLVNLNRLSPLHLAVALNQLDWVKLLLQAHGPLAKAVCGQPMTVGAYGLTPLHLAIVCVEDQGECATLLTREVPAIVAFFSAKADDGLTPANYAAEVPQRYRSVTCKLHDRLTCAINTVLTLLEENEASGVLWCTMSCDLARQQLREEAQSSEEPEESTLLAVSILNTLAEDYSTYGIAELPGRYAQFFHESMSDCGSGLATPAISLSADTVDVSPGALWRSLCDSARQHQPGNDLSRTAPVATLTQVWNKPARVHQPSSELSRTAPVVPNHLSHTFTSSTDLPLLEMPAHFQKSQPSSKSSEAPIWDSARHDPPSTTIVNVTAPVNYSAPMADMSTNSPSKPNLFMNGTIPPAIQTTKRTSKRTSSVASSHRRSVKKLVLNMIRSLWRPDKYTSGAVSKEAAALAHPTLPERANSNPLLRTVPRR